MSLKDDLPDNPEADLNELDVWKLRAEQLQRQKENADRKILELEKEIRDLLTGITNERAKRQVRERQLKMEVKAMEIQLRRLREENTRIKRPMEGKIRERISEVLDTEVEEEEEDDVNVEVLQHFDEKYWDDLKTLLVDFPMALSVIKGMLEKKDVKLIILAMMLMTDHNACLEVLKELEKLDLVTIESKKDDDLNPRVVLKNYLNA